METGTVAIDAGERVGNVLASTTVGHGQWLANTLGEEALETRCASTHDGDLDFGLRGDEHGVEVV